jgi:putative aldouronate transport system permease protein
VVSNTAARKVFRVCNTVFFILYALLCLIPIIHIVAMSFSASTAVSSGKVTLAPVEPTLKSYEYVLRKSEFWRAFRVSLVRVVLGVGINMLMVILAAFPLSKTKQDFCARTVFVWFFMITMLFSGGMIPSFMIVKYTGLLNSIWALILPGAVPVFNVVLLMNFFKAVPKELEESAFMDGAGYGRILFQIYLPVSLPALATLTVFALVTHWNSWFDGMIYMSDAKNYPMQTYLQSIMVSTNTKLMTKAQGGL